MPIEALPQATVRAIGSSSVITDPCSVVKELLDNALDASASSVAVEVSLNTVDVIQVKDNGIGISTDDHPVVCRHACTSKIQTVDDLKNVGGDSFGFRGEALASMAEVSGGISVTTRTALEVTGSCVKYSRDGEISQTQPIAHPVGTTVRISDFLKYIPVRKQTVVKGATKTLHNLRKLLRVYSFARPSCRFSLKVLKAKNENHNWMYVPNAEAEISNTAVNIVGREASSCCFVKTFSSESEGYCLTALLPRPDADLSKINNLGQFINLDGRPLNSSRGVCHDIVKSYKTYLRSIAARNTSSKTITDPFLFLQITCPKGVYDVNIEPGKDDVLFEDRETIITLVEDLFKDCYGPLAANSSNPSKKSNAATIPIDINRQTTERDVGIPTPCSPPETPIQYRPRKVIQHRERRRECLSQPNREPLSDAKNHNELDQGNGRRNERERDRERYGNGALDTWFQRTTQTSISQTPLDQSANIDELVPTLSQLAERRFGTEAIQQSTEATRENETNTTSSASDDVESPSSPQNQISPAGRCEGTMNTGRGYPVLEHWAASLKEDLNNKAAPGLEWAMDFERRKKEANQKNRDRSTTTPSSSQPLSSQASQKPHQNRFLAAKAALAADRPFTSEVVPEPRIPPHDPRAYLMRHEGNQRLLDEHERGSSVRRIHTSRLPFERIPEGCDLHDICLSLPTNSPSIYHSSDLTAPNDSYIMSGEETRSFNQIEALVPLWAQRLQSIIAKRYKGSNDSLCLDEMTLSSIITKHMQQDN